MARSQQDAGSFSPRYSLEREPLHNAAALATMVSLSALPAGILLLLANSSAVDAFAPSPPVPSSALATTSLGARATSAKKDVEVDGWTSVTDDYLGCLGARAWSVEDVVACWLPDQCAEALLPDLFRSFDIDGARLSDRNFLTAEFA